MKLQFFGGHASVDIMPGSHIEHAAQDAIALAKMIDGPVYFDFNGVALVAKPDSDVKDLAGRFHHGQQYERLASSLNGAAKP
jgi:hypothetical protein